MTLYSFLLWGETRVLLQSLNDLLNCHWVMLLTSELPSAIINEFN